MIFIREDVEKLLFYERKYKLSKYFRNIICPDEHYFINVLLYIIKSEIIQKQIVFCNPDLHKTQALIFSISKITPSFINNLRNNGFLFMRKVQ